MLTDVKQFFTIYYSSVTLTPHHHYTFMLKLLLINSCLGNFALAFRRASLFTEN